LPTPKTGAPARRGGGLLRQRLSRHLGADAEAAREEDHRPLLDQLEQRAAELEADNHRQRQQIAELQNDVSELTETLDAARSTNRELMTELNRSDARGDRKIPARSRGLCVTYVPSHSRRPPTCALAIDYKRKLDGRAASGAERTAGPPGPKDDPLYRARRVLLRGEERLDEKAAPVWPRCSRWATPTARWPSPIGSKRGSVTSTTPMTPAEARAMLEVTVAFISQRDHAIGSW